MAKKKIGIVLALDGEKEFTQALAAANSSLKVTKSETAKLKAEFEGQQNSIEALSAMHMVLSRKVEEQTQKQKAAIAGLKHAEENYKAAKERLAQLNKALEEAKNQQKAMAESGKATEKELKDQERAVNDLADAVERQQNQFGRHEAKIQDWKQKINTADKELIQANQTLKKNTAYMKEAEEAVDGCATSIDKFGKTTSAVSEIAFGIKEGILAGAGGTIASKGIDAVTKAAGALVGKIKEVAVESEKASSQLQATAGLSESMAQKYSDVMESIQGDNFGEGYDDIAEAMGQIVQVMGELDPSAMEEVTQNAIVLRDTFGMDYNETIRGADALMKNMGLSAKEAFDYITVGAQNGLNRSGELVDNLMEYSQLWGQAGFSAEEMFSILDNGLESGAYNLDKVNDFVKEFGISLSDGRMSEQIGSFSEKTQGLFAAWQQGGASTKDVFYSVINDLSSMTNQQEALTIASNTWSAVGEDNSLKVITALDDANQKYKDVTGAAEELKKVKYDDIGSSFERLGKTITENLVDPIVDKAVPALKRVVDGINETLDPEDTFMDQTKDRLKENIKSIEEQEKAAEEAARAAQGEIDRVTELTAELSKLVAAEDQEYKSKYRVAEIINELKDTMPELLDAYDQETNSLKLTSEEIEEYAEKRKKALLSDSEAKSQDAFNDSLERTKQIVNDYELQIGELEQKKSNLLKLQEENPVDFYAYAPSIEMLEEDIAVLAGELEKYKKLLDEGTKDAEEYQKAQEQTVPAIEEMGQAVSLLPPDLKRAKQAQMEAEETSKKQAEAYGVLYQSTVDAGEGIGDLAGKTEEANEKIKASEREAAEARKTAARSVCESYEEMKQSIADNLQGKISIFEGFDGGEDLTTEQMNANLNDWVTSLENYKDNLSRVRKMVDEEGKALISPEFLEYIEELGPEGANMLEHMVWTWENQGEDGIEQLRGMNDKYCRAMDLTEGMAKTQAANKIAAEAAFGELGSTDIEFEDLRDSIEYAAQQAAGGWENLSAETEQKLLETVDLIESLGGKIPEGLTEAIESGEAAPEAAIEQLNASLQGHLEGLVQIAEENGINVGDHIKSGILAGGDQAVQAMAELVQLLGAYNVDFETAGKEAAEAWGQSTGEEMSAQAEAAGSAAKAAQEAYQNAGESISAAMVEGMSSNSENVSKVAGDAAQKGAEAASGQSDTYTAAAALLIRALSVAMEAGAGDVQGAVTAVASGGATAAANMSSSYANAGLMMALGLARGIAQGHSSVVNEAVSLATAALNAAKEALEIHSPSRKFQSEVGEQISAGMAFGIKKKKKLAAREAEELSRDTFQAATGWLDAYKQKHAVSLEEEKYFWQQVSAQLKKGSKEYQKAQDQINNITSDMLKVAGDFGVSWHTDQGKKKEAEDYYSEIYSVANKYLSNMQVIRDIDLRQEEAYWDSVAAKLAQGTQGWYDAMGQLKNIREQIKKENQQIEKELRREKQNDREDRKSYALSGDALDTYKTYFKVSLQAEESYWNMVRKKFKKGTAERAEADEKYFEAKRAKNEALKDLEEDYADKVAETTEDMAEEVKKVEEELSESIQEITSDMEEQLEDFKKDYEDTIKDISEKTEEEIKNLTDAYKQAVDDREKAIYSATSLTDKFESETEDGATLLYNIETQVKGLDDWRKQLDKLKEKGLDEGLIKELQEEGPGNLAMLHVLNGDMPEGMKDKGMTEEQLKAFEGNWKELKELSRKQAEEENEQLKRETEEKIAAVREQAKAEREEAERTFEEKSAQAREQAEQEIARIRQESEQRIAELRSSAQKEIQAYTEEYLKGVEEITAPMNGSLKHVAKMAVKSGEDTITNYIQGVYDKVKDKKSKQKLLNTTEEITKNLGSLKSSGKKIGEDTLDGILKAMNNSKKIKKSTSAMVKAIVRETKKAARINSPSKLFEEEVGEYIPAGVGEGMEKNAKAAAEPARNMIREIILAAEAQQQAESAKLTAYIQNMHFDAGIARLNAAMQTPVQNQTNVNVDNSALAGLFAQMLNEMREIVSAANEKEIVLDDGTLVGRLQPKFSQESAMIARKKGRGLW